MLKAINKFFASLFILFINLYRTIRYFIYPKKTCRFYPSCSEYAIISFKHYNVIKALFKSIWRILRCNPFNYGGYDPPISDKEFRRLYVRR